MIPDLNRRASQAPRASVAQCHFVAIGHLTNDQFDLLPPPPRFRSLSLVIAPVGEWPRLLPISYVRGRSGATSVRLGPDRPSRFRSFVATEELRLRMASKLADAAFNCQLEPRKL